MKKIVTILLFALTVFAGCSKDEESELPTFREAITLKVENHEI